MLFLCEHETQGLAYQQALSCDVPVLAWDPGAWLDPWRYRYGEGYVPATSVPYFDERCGMTFSALQQFRDALAPFLDRLRGGRFRARDYVLENLTLEASARKYIELLQSI
jgi:glycosyltransferase involved in cell wall biosynthesis